MKLKSVLFTVLLTLPLLGATTAQAQWALDNAASQLSFVTTKAEHVAEVHTFDVLSGSLGATGALSVTIELASVNTLIPIRDERMQNLLFETNLFPEAAVSAQVDISELTAMMPGESLMQEVMFDLSMRGDSNSYTAQLMLLRTSDGVIASTLKPVIVTADSFGLLDGVEALREVAGLPSISRAVPVSFTVTFRD